jgi:hypothetical protein
VIRLESAERSGWLAARYEQAYERLARGRADGEPRMLLAPLEQALTVHIALQGSLQAAFTWQPQWQEQAWELAVHDDGARERTTPEPLAVMAVAYGDRALDVVVRELPYAPGQGLLLAPCPVPQEARADLLLVAFAFSRAMGSGYTSTFNVAGRTRDNFHAQFFRGSAPLCRAVEEGVVASVAEREVLPGVRRFEIDGWPARCSLFVSSGLAAMAQAIGREAASSRARGDSYDLLYWWSGDDLAVLFFPRVAGGSWTELGQFGALELAGWVLSIRDGKRFEQLTQRSERLSATYRRILRQATVGPPPGRATWTTPPSMSS